MEVKKGYKKTIMGEIPSDWELCEFSDVMDGFTSGQTPYRAIKKYYTGKIPWITSGELNYNIIVDTNEKITEEAVRNTGLKIIPKGTFLFAITGLEAEGTRGSCAITGIDAATNQSCMALYPRKNKLVTQYLYQYYLRYGKELALKYCQGTKQQSFTSKIAKTLPIIVPPTVEEQTAISTVLTETDTLIDKLEKFIEKKRSIKQGVIHNLLQPKDKWKKKKLKDICLIFKGKGLSKSAVSESGWKPCILYGELFTTYSEVVKSVKSRTNINVGVSSKKGDILFPGSTTTTGIDLAKGSALMLDNVLLGGDIIVIRPKQNTYNPIFLSYFLNSKRVKEIAEKTKGITIHHLYGRDLSEIDAEFPTIEEQDSIATILCDLDEEIRDLVSRLEKYKCVKSGMMQHLLTGKIRLI